MVRPEGVTLSGPATRRSWRDLHGRGWAVGTLLRPASVPAFTNDPGSLRDLEVSYAAPELHAAVAAVMKTADANTDADDDGSVRRARAAAVVGSWLETRVPDPSPEARLANRLEDLIRTQPSLTRVDQAAEQLGLSVRTLQRLARRYVGLPPLAMIRRYRLQEAVERLRTDPGTGIADIAAELGYADHAHLTAAFREVLGFSPSGYRRSAAPESAPPAD